MQLRDDCIAYNISSGMWEAHSVLAAAREEGACAVVGGNMFILGGIIDGDQSFSVEVWDCPIWF